jgi:hypothetical protein
MWVADRLAGGILFVIASGNVGFDVAAGFAANGYGAHSPGGYSLVAGLVTEIVMTSMFLIVILGATDKRAPQGLAPIAIGLALTLIHLISIPVTATSVNPARSTRVAVFVGGWAISQLWLFWVAPTGGIGVKLVNLPATTLAVGLGGGGVWEKDYGFDTNASGALTFDEKFAHKLTPTATIGQTFLALWKTSDFGDALYTFGANFAAAINTRAQLKVELLDTYKNKPQDVTLKKNDVSLIVGVVFKV